jgi:hypothetical protein
MSELQIVNVTAAPSSPGRIAPALCACLALFLPHRHSVATESELSTRDGHFPAYPPQDLPKWKAYAAAQYIDDDNLFRVSDEASLASGEEPGDRFLVLSAGVAANLESNRQKLNFDARVDDYSFDRNSILDDQMYRGAIAWTFGVGGPLQGTFGYAQSRSYPDFSELQFASDMRTAVSIGER